MIFHRSPWSMLGEGLYSIPQHPTALDTLVSLFLQIEEKLDEASKHLKQ